MIEIKMVSKYSVFVVVFISSICMAHCKEDEVLITVRNYLDISDNATVNFSITNLITSKTVEFPSSLYYSNKSLISILDNNDCSINVWRMNYTILEEDDDTEYQVPDLMKADFDGTCRNICITVYGSLDHAEFKLDFEEKRSSSGSLGIDKASIKFSNHLPYPVTYSEVPEVCYKCRPKPVGTVIPGQSVLVTVSTQYKMTYYFQSTANSVCSPLSHHFEEHGHYSYHLGSNSSVMDGYYCILKTTMKQHGNAYMPILYVGIILLGSFLIWVIGTKVYVLIKKKGLLHFRKINRQLNQDLGNPEVVQKEYGTVNKTERDQLLASSSESISPPQKSPSTGSGKKRLKSLDTVRGLSLIIMIFVNYGGGGYWFFAHSRWNGVTVADLVFPWFVWIMGVSIVFSFKGRKKDSFSARLYQIIRRTVILMCLGLFLNNGFVLSKWRIPGVLQRFAASYFVVALTELLSQPLYSILDSKISKLSFIHDIIYNSVQWVTVLLLEIVWLSVTFGLNVPGCPRGYLGPGGLSENGTYWNCTGGAAGYIDKWILTYSHVYHHPTCKDIYQCGPYDPEGILGTLNSIVICFLGVQAGKILIYHEHHVSRLLRFIVWGVLLGGIALALSEGRENGGLIPLNKNLWSLSFILAMAGMGFILLTVFYVLIDIFGVWNGAPFIYPGMNSILVYVGSELFEGMFPFGWSGMENTHLTFLISNVVSVSLWALIAYYWFVIEFFVKI